MNRLLKRGDLFSFTVDKDADVYVVTNTELFCIPDDDRDSDDGHSVFFVDFNNQDQDERSFYQTGPYKKFEPKLITYRGHAKCIWIEDKE